MTPKIAIDNITIKNHQAHFLDPIQFEITFSNLTPLPHEIQWKIIYFGSAIDEDHDQILQQFQIPPVEQVQTMKFQLSCSPPDITKIPRKQLLSVTAIILTVSYKGQQFIRVGYYIHYQYCGEQSPQSLGLLSAEEVVKNAKRTILYDKPRVTKFNIQWEDRKKTASDSQRQRKQSGADDKAMQEQQSEKHNNIQKQSTLQEKQQRSNGFSSSVHEISPNSIPLE